MCDRFSQPPYTTQLPKEQVNKNILYTRKLVAYRIERQYSGVKSMETI